MRIQKILLAVALQRYLDITPHALVARDVAMDLASLHKAGLFVLTTEFHLALMPEGESTEDKLKRFMAPILEKGIKAESLLREGSPRKLIPQVAREVGADLIVLGSHSKRGILDTRLGGTARAVIENAPCRIILTAPTREEAAKTRDLIIPEYPFIFPYG